MKSKRILVLMLVLSMLVTTLVGCGKDADETSESVEGSGDVVLTMAIWDKYQEPVLREIADKFEAENPNVKIDIQLTPWGQYWTKLETAATGEVLPDIFWMNGPNIVKYADNGLLLPIDERIEKDNLDLSVFPKGLIDLYTVDGTLYGIPKDWDLTALWYNKKLFDEKGLEYPNENWTWDDMVEAARKLTDESKGIYGTATRLDDSQVGIYNTIPQSGGFVISEDRKKSGYDSAEAIHGVQIWIDLIEEGLAPTLEEQADISARELFVAGKLGMIYAASWDITALMENEAIRDDIDLTVMPLIKERAAVIHGLSYAIAANTEHPDEAWEFVKYLAGEEANKIWAESGVVIPAREDVLDIWKNSHPNLNLQAFIDSLEYSVGYPTSKETSKWNDLEREYIKRIWNGDISAEEGLKELAEQMNQLLELE